MVCQTNHSKSLLIFIDVKLDLNRLIFVQGNHQKYGFPYPYRYKRKTRNLNMIQIILSQQKLLQSNL